MKWFLDVLRGMVIGLANVIPGVSGGTMMVSMGIYDKLIYSINHIFKKFKECFTILLPYLIGMAAAILIGSFGLKAAFTNFPLPTNALFIGLILGSLPFILKEMKGETIGWQGVLAFVLFFALVVGLKAIEKENVATLTLNVGSVLLMLLLGAICSAAMVIPGVSGSMILKTLGYYEPVVTEAIPGLVKGVTGGNWDAVLHNIGILLPFLIGIVCGIFGIAKLIEILMKKWKGRTYCAILGMVIASPVAILMDTKIYEGFNVWIGIASVVALAAGGLIAFKLGGDPEPVKE
jgi:putative membrane protein